MELKNKRIGIWGLGVSGRAILSYLATQECSLSVLEKQLPENLSSKGIKTPTFFKDPNERTQFFTTNDLIVPSPGIDITPELAAHQTDTAPHGLNHKILTEIDLFASAWHKPLIAITGTLGKTSTTHLLSMLLSAHGKKIATGGNIGIGMLDLIPLQEKSDYAVLELSSFQLEHAHFIAPNLAIITNLYENHLDRHKTMVGYFDAKKQILLHQKPGQQALLPLELAPLIRADKNLKDRHLSWFTSKNIETVRVEFQTADNNLNDTLFCLDSNGHIVMHTISHENAAPIHLLGAQAIPTLSFKENWITLAAACHLLGFSLQAILQNLELSIPHNRLEFVATVNGVTYINDSKSTIIQATSAAVNSITASMKEQSKHPLILLLGGVSKGVDRTRHLSGLKKVSLVLCFGKEAKILADACLHEGIAAESYDQLEPALEAAHKKAPPGATVLFSPGGASFDLFKNYEERGQRFITLVHEMLKQQTD
ncbi:TPA: UDP-N-acetylmuramoyl-L-alanine--D-glutamate ligase [Candidatus Dependentiae bacterium]|nr:MAG: UDP-N-acetylmuramoylalanine-D-glutamate ligase [candidate division TM6 bacterium GW2011_GWF2_43_87]HBL98745.1 UDP-N-acetylmuramoyl-L-alanine--D-glutamate ligase [Candidatus Dependentiae bacterium]